MAENVSIGKKVSPKQQEGLTFVDLIKILKKHWISGVITGFIVFAVVMVITMMIPAKYSSTTQLFASYGNTEDTTDNYSNMNNASSYVSNQIKSYPTLAKTEIVLNPVIKEMGLNTTARALAQQLTITNPTNTAFINITVTTNDPSRASAVANSIGNSLIKVVESSLYSNQKTSPISLTTVQPAITPSKPSSPNVPLLIFGGLVVGIVCGLIMAFLRGILSRKIQDENELESYINAPTLGRVPEDERVKENAPVIISEPGSPVAEDYRRICTNLSFIAPISGTNSRLVVVSAVGANEGKTTTAVNIATALAETGSAVLLIDADLRNPCVAKKLDIDGSAGLAHVLSGQASVKDVVQRFWKANLHIMPAGPKPPNAAQLLNSPIMSELINNALHQYDYVIIDTAPLVVANDGALFAKQGGGLVMVSRRGVTLKKQLSETAAELANLNVDVTGFVFNCAKYDKKLAGSSYYYYTSSSDSQSKERHSSHSKDKH